jgi:hypothetical protein
VVWNDAHGKTAGEYTVEEIKRDHHKPAPIHTFGLLIADDAVGVTVAQEITGTEEVDGADTYRSLGFIPRAMVLEVLSFGIPKRPKPKRTPKRTPPTRLKGEVPLPLEGEEEVATLPIVDVQKPTEPHLPKS